MVYRRFLLGCMLVAGAGALAAPVPIEEQLAQHEKFVSLLPQLKSRFEYGLLSLAKQPDIVKMQCIWLPAQMAHSVGQARRDEEVLDARRAEMSADQLQRLESAKSKLRTVSPEFEACRE